MLTIVTHPNEILRTRASAIADPLSQEMKTLGREMVETMRFADGVGLAGPQVSQKKRICIIRSTCVDYKDISADQRKQIKSLLKKDSELVLIIPKFVMRGKVQVWGEEGCLSIPGVYGDVERASAIQLEALSSLGEALSFIAGHFFARVIQHEVDHLDGILFIDKARNLKIDHAYTPSYRLNFLEKT
jgi:peptide deformylase